MRYEHNITKPSSESVPDHITVICAGEAYDDMLTSLWGYIEQAAVNNKRPWIFSDDCASVWHQVGLWDMLESGQILLSGVDHRLQGQALKFAQMRSTGYICIEDPPCVLKFCFKGSSRMIVWTDARNYGLTPELLGESPVDRHAALARWAEQAIAHVQTHKLGRWCATVGSQALTGWRKTYLKTGVYCHDHSGATALEMAGYFGGRCEAMRLGNHYGLAYSVDYRSLYPAICSRCTLPVRLQRYSNSDFISYSIAECNSTSAIARVTIKTEQPLYPYRTQVPRWSYDGKTYWRIKPSKAACDTGIVYPTGIFETTLCGPELTLAFSRGHVCDVSAVATYHMAPALRDYAEMMYSARCMYDDIGDKCMERYCKALLVSIVGKLGQRDRKWLACPDDGNDVLYGAWLGTDPQGEVCRYRAIAGYVYREQTLGFAYDAVPAMAAFITSAGRVELLKAIEIAGWENVYYCDTDGLIVGRSGYYLLCRHNLLAENTLGMLRHVESADECTINGVKSYAIGRQVRNAGLSRSTCDRPHCLQAGGYRRRLVDDIHSGQRPANPGVRNNNQGRSVYRGGVPLDGGKVRPYHVVDGELK